MSDMDNPLRPKIQDLKAKNTAVKAVLDQFGQKGSGEREVTLHKAYMDSTGLDKVQVTKALKQIADIGLGRFIVGRKGYESRFLGRRDLRSIYELSLKEGVSVEIPMGDHTVSNETSSTQSSLSETAGPINAPSPTSPTMLDHPFHLRPTLEIRLILPQDLTQSEASRIASFVQSLPF